MFHFIELFSVETESQGKYREDYWLPGTRQLEISQNSACMSKE